MKLKSCAIPLLIRCVFNPRAFFTVITFLNPRVLLAQDSNRVVYDNPGVYTINRPSDVTGSESVIQVARIIVRMTNNEEVEGVLLSVRQNTLVVATMDEIEGKNTSEIMKYVRFLSTNEIQQVIIQGESKILQGMGIGLLCGGLVGAVIGFADGDDKTGFFRLTAGQKAGIGGIVFGVIGLVVGIIAGATSSTTDRTVDPLPGQDFSTLKVLARYQDVEPQWLQSMQ